MKDEISLENKAGWIERGVVFNVNHKDLQSAKCKYCGKYHTTIYMYYFYDYKYCPNCGKNMEE